jgi:hypothetical protein
MQQTNPAALQFLGEVCVHLFSKQICAGKFNLAGLPT